MARSWKFLIQVGADDEETRSAAPALAAVPAPDLDGVWEIMLGARRNLVGALESGDQTKINDINHWIGGGLAVLAQVMGKPSEVLLERLKAEVPYEPPDTSNFIPVRRERPKPHPGAQRSVDISELSDEELAEIGIERPTDAT